MRFVADLCHQHQVLLFTKDRSVSRWCEDNLETGCWRLHRLHGPGAGDKLDPYD